MKQTAVEWLIDQLTPSISLQQKHIDELKNQAKEMEKAQIVDACNSQRNDYRGMPTYNKSGEQYYNETYGGKK